MVWNFSFHLPDLYEGSSPTCHPSSVYQADEHGFNDIYQALSNALNPFPFPSTPQLGLACIAPNGPAVESTLYLPGTLSLYCPR